MHGRYGTLSSISVVAPSSMPVPSFAVTFEMIRLTFQGPAPVSRNSTGVTGAVVRKFTDLDFRLRPAAVGAVVTLGLLATLCGPSRAQVVRVNQTDPDTNKFVVAVVAPARDTRSAFVVTCNSHYAVRTYEVSRVFTPWAKLAVQFGQYQPIAADGEIKAPDQLRITLASAEQERFGSELRATQQLSV